MDPAELAAALTRLEAGQGEIMRRLSGLEAGASKGRDSDRSLAERVTRLEERNAMLMRLVWGSGAAGAAALAGHGIRLLGIGS